MERGRILLLCGRSLHRVGDRWSFRHEAHTERWSTVGFAARKCLVSYDRVSGRGSLSCRLAHLNGGTITTKFLDVHCGLHLPAGTKPCNFADLRMSSGGNKVAERFLVPAIGGATLILFGAVVIAIFFIGVPVWIGRTCKAAASPFYQRVLAPCALQPKDERGR